jgi:cationic peptide transport system ATP-binding protein
LQRDLGLGFIFISHNLGIVRHISDKVIIMKAGKVVESGKTDVIFNWPKNEYTKKLVKAASPGWLEAMTHENKEEKGSKDE